MSYASSDNSDNTNPHSMLCGCCDLRNLRNRKINIVWEEERMFPGRLKTTRNHIGGFIKEPIKLLARKWDGMLIKQIAQLTQVNK